MLFRSITHYFFQRWNVTLILLPRSFRNQIVLFTGVRYLCFGLMFLRGILLARFLGPSLFGVWGFLTLIQQYLSYLNFGSHHAINVQLATRSDATPRADSGMIGMALLLSGVIAVLLALTGWLIQGLELPVFEKYSFSQFALAVGVIAGLSHVQQVLTNVYRVYRELPRIAAIELFSAVVPLVVVLTFRDDSLIHALQASVVCTGVVGVIVFFVRMPFAISLDFTALRSSLALGIPLIIFNASFYLITMVAQTVISVGYSPEIMGYYSLANSITFAILLGINSVGWVFFPEVISRTRAGLDDVTVAHFVQRVNDLFGTAVFLVVFTAILLLPALFVVLPEYEHAKGFLTVLALSQAVFSAGFGYGCLALARGKHMALARISMFAVLAVMGSCLLVSLLEIPYIWIAVSVLVGSIYFTFQQAVVGCSLIRENVPRMHSIRSVLPFGTLAAILICVSGALTDQTSLGGVGGLAVFCATNPHKLRILILSRLGLRRPILRTPSE